MQASIQRDITTLDLDTVLQQSAARRNSPLLAPLLLGVILIGAILSMPGDSPWLAPLFPLAMAFLIVFAIAHSSKLARRQREEMNALRMADEGMRLGNWQQASAVLSQVLLAPPMRPHVRFQGLIYLGGILSRIGRYADVIRLYEHLLQQAQFPPQIAFTLRSMRAYAMLRDDRLSDAYQALGELRRESTKPSGMLSLLELYRSVKTGHHDDALQIFSERKTVMAQQLGHRSSDAWALAGVSALALGRREDAVVYAQNAIILGNSDEITRRFPETAAVLELANSGEVKT